MTRQLKRPILWGGVGLSLGLWLMESVAGTPSSGLGLTGAVALSAGVWWLRQRSGSSTLPLPEIQLPQIDLAMVEGALAQAEETLQRLGAETTPQETPALTGLGDRLDQLRTERDRQELRVAIVGGQAVGKSSLIQALAQHWRPQNISKLVFLDTPQLFSHGSATGSLAIAAADNETMDWSIPEAVLRADVLMFVTAGDVTNTELRCLRWLKLQTARLLVVVNKQDQHLPDDQAKVLSQVRLSLREILPAGDVMAIAAQPSPVRVLQHQIDGSVVQHFDSSDPQLTLLLDRLDQLLVAEPLQQLVWGTLCHHANALAAEAKTWLDHLRRQRAQRIIDQYQWVSAGAAFLNPVPSLDLLATAAVSSQLVADLAQIYHQPLSPDHAKTWAIALSEVLIKLGLVEVSTQALGLVLKSNGLTYVAGGMIQGASAAYLTRTVGLSLVDYFEALAVTGEDPQSLSLDRLKQLLQRTFEAGRQGKRLQGFATQALEKLKPEVQAEPVSHPVHGSAQ